jgi:antitoxin (DNA-binding transcriptional repressor) of toxin-antitoxin stability system
MSKAIVSATEFKAKCLDLLDQISSGELDELAVTKRGRVVARLVPPVAPVRPERWHGFMQGSLGIDPGIDLTQPVTDETWDAELGVLHR